MAKGRYIKAAERACAAKARYDSALDAERACDWRYRAYQCPVCHGYHLTSLPGNPATPRENPPSPVSAQPRSPTLADLDWSPALDPQPKAPRPAKKKSPPKRVEPLPEPTLFVAKCLGTPGADGRVRMVLKGCLVKSAKVRAGALRAQLTDGVEVLVDDSDPPNIVRRA